MDSTRAISVDVIVSGTATDGAYGLLDVRLAPGAVLAPHVVERERLDLCVLEGALEVVVDGVRHHLVGGSHVALPPAVPRALAAPGAARALCLSTPAGVERLAAILVDPSLPADDRAAFLAAAGVRLLPRRLWTH